MPRSRWWLDTVIGGVVGGLIAAVVAINLTIYLGPASGYETGLAELFAHSLPVGLLVTAVLLMGPVLGVLLAHRWRSKSKRDGRSGRA